MLNKPTNSKRLLLSRLFRTACAGLLVATLSLDAHSVTPQEDATRPPLRIGATLSDTGALAEFGVLVRRGLLMWQADVNERGGLLGRTVELVLHDDASDAPTAVRYYRDMVASGINLFVGPYSSELTLAVRDALPTADFAMVSIASSPQIWDRTTPKIFGAYTPANHNMDPFLKLVAQRGLSRVALAYQDAEFPRAVAEGVRAKAKELNLSIVLDEKYAVQNPDFTDLAKAIQASAPDAVVVGSYLQDAIEFTKAAKNNGVKPKLMAFSGGPALREFGNAVGTDVADGIISTAQWMRSVRMPGSFDFGFRYQLENGVYPSYDAAGGYAAGQILEASMRLADSATPADVRDKLATMKFRSILGHYRADQNGMQNAKSMYLVQWQNSHISLIYPPELARWQILYPMLW